MKIKYGKGKTKCGKGVVVTLSRDEIATAIDAYLVAQGVCIRGPRTISVNRELCNQGQVYVDPSGFVVFEGKEYPGNFGSF